MQTKYRYVRKTSDVEDYRDDDKEDKYKDGSSSEEHEKAGKYGDDSSSEEQ